MFCHKTPNCFSDHFLSKPSKVELDVSCIVSLAIQQHVSSTFTMGSYKVFEKLNPLVRS